MSVIYKITNTQNGKIYIGSTKNFHKRKLRHINELRKGKHHNIYLQRCWIKTNDESVYKFDILEKCKVSQLFEKEQKWIDKLKPEYNIGGVCGGDNFTNHPNKEQLKKKLVKQLKEAPKPKPRFGENNPNWKNGKTFFECPVCKKNMRITKKPKTCRKCRNIDGGNNPFHGKKHSKETIEKLRKANKGKKPINSKKITIDGVTYNSYSDAAKAIGVCTATILNRIKKGLYPS